jgi:isocitrate dehydrogenase kinase/phosphatase
MARHGDLFQPEFWRRMQEKFLKGDVPEIFPYAQECRLGNSLSAGARA